MQPVRKERIRTLARTTEVLSDMDELVAEKANTAQVIPLESLSLQAGRQRRSNLRSKTLGGRRLSREEIEEGLRLMEGLEYERPKTRSECAGGMRPCPFVSCKYHLYLDVKEETKSIKLNFPHLEVWEMEHSCALDVSEQGGMTLEDVGHVLNLTRERVRQVESAGLAVLKKARVIEDIERVFGDDNKFDAI